MGTLLSSGRLILVLAFWLYHSLRTVLPRANSDPHFTPTSGYMLMGLVERKTLTHLVSMRSTDVHDTN